MISNKGLCAVKGFKFAGVSAESSKKNIGLIYSTSSLTYGAAVYTKSDITAAPVKLSKSADNKSKIK